MLNSSLADRLFCLLRSVSIWITLPWLRQSVALSSTPGCEAPIPPRHPLCMTRTASHTLVHHAMLSTLRHRLTLREYRLQKVPFPISDTVNLLNVLHPKQHLCDHFITSILVQARRMQLIEILVPLRNRENRSTAMKFCVQMKGRGARRFFCPAGASAASQRHTASMAATA